MVKFYGILGVVFRKMNVPFIERRINTRPGRLTEVTFRHEPADGIAAACFRRWFLSKAEVVVDDSCPEPLVIYSHENTPIRFLYINNVELFTILSLP